MAITKEQVEKEAAKHYLKGHASYYAFIRGAEYVLTTKEQGHETDKHLD